MTDSATTLVRRLPASVRAAALYSPTHPVVQRGIDELLTQCRSAIGQSDRLVIGCIADEVLIDGERIRGSNVTLAGLTRLMRDHVIETITLQRGITGDDLTAFVAELRTTSDVPLDGRLDRARIEHISVGQLAVESTPSTTAAVGVAVAKRSYDEAVARSGSRRRPATRQIRAPRAHWSIRSRTWSARTGQRSWR